jgi:epsin
MRHLWKKLNCPPKEWRRIYKTLHAMEYLIKNGAPRCIQEIKDDLYKIRSLQDFNFSENGTDRGQGVRDRARSICELLSDTEKLQQEREFARKTREKLQGAGSTPAP